MSNDNIQDSYDPEFGIGENCQIIRDALQEVYKELSFILNKLHAPPIPILELLKGKGDYSLLYQPALTEKELRLCRFAIERALETI